MPKKMNKREALKNKVQTRSVGVTLSRAAEELDDNTLSFVIVSNDNAGVRFDWGSGEYFDEVLDVNGATTTRLNTFFKDHSRNVDSAVGKPHNVRVEDGQLIADVTFGTDDDSQKVLSKYREGILTDVSIGYEIKDYRVEKRAENERDIVTVTDFDILELSAVGIGFDSGAKKRSEDNFDEGSEMNEKQRKRLAELESMSKRNEDEIKELNELLAVRDAANSNAEKERKRLLDENKELKRVNDCQDIVNQYGERAKAAFAAKPDATPEELRSLVLDSFMADQNGGQRARGSEMNERESLVQALTDGLALRVGATLTDVHEDAHKYRNAPLTTIANMLLPENERSFDPVEIAERSLVTGDFPILLLAVGNRVLTSEFEAQTSTYQAWVAQTDVMDFRTNTEITKGRGGRLDKTLENGDLKELSFAEKAESWKLTSFGNKFVLTREMLINDDLGAFTDVIGEFAVMAKNTVNGIAYDLLRMTGDYANYKMGDGSLVYSAAHGNKTTAALTPTSLSDGKKAMAKQKGIDGKTPLNIKPKFLIVGPGLEQTAREILGATNKIDASANTGEINVHHNSLTLIVDSELNDTEWYLAAERRTIKIGYLSGTNRQPVVKKNESTLIRTTFEGVFDIGAVVEDYRGLFQGNQ